MDCDRLQTLIKSWYVQVQDEALAPARMVSFMEKHIEECATCLADPVVKSEVEKITTIVLPPSKIPKAVKDKEAKEKAAEEKVEEVETAKKAKKSKKKAPAKIAVKAKAAKRIPAKKKVVVRPVKKAKKVAVTDEVLKIIKRYKKGVDISRLKERTGFADSKLRMIVSRAYKQGKIKRIGRGIYIAA